MKKKIGSLVGVILAISIMPSLAQGDPPLAKVTGGGIGRFDEPHPFPETTFGISASLYDGGVAVGHFNCLIGGIVVINGDVNYWYVNSEGNVTVGGTGKITCPGDPHSEDPACQDVEFFEVSIDATGGAGVGHFTYFDSFMNGLGLPPDAETVVKGQLQIHQN